MNKKGGSIKTTTKNWIITLKKIENREIVKTDERSKTINNNIQS